jgi:hypothetical protein
MTVIIELQMFEEEKIVDKDFFNPYAQQYQQHQRDQEHKSAAPKRQYVRKADKEERERTGKGPDGLYDARFIEKPNFDPKLLAAKNSHPLDATIRMIEETHIYYVRWEPKKPQETTDSISVSKIIDTHFPIFQPEVQVTKMAKIKQPDGVEVHTGKWAGYTSPELLVKWEEDGKLARDTGTMVHFIIECFLNGMEIGPFLQFRVMRHFLAWYQKDILDQGWLPFRTEMRMRSDAALRLTGTTDAMFVHKDQKPQDGVLRIKMVDWKFTKEIDTYSRFGKKGYGLCSHLDDCKKDHYGIQQWSYKKMFETWYAPFEYNGYSYPKVEIIKMDLLVLHDTLSEAIVVSMNDPLDTYSYVVDALFKERYMMLQEKRS